MSDYEDDRGEVCYGCHRRFTDWDELVTHPCPSADGAYIDERNIFGDSVIKGDYYEESYP